MNEDRVSKHTPGEWKRSGLTIIGPHPKGDGRDRVIARCVHAPGTYVHEAVANSRLISAAPDLMEALEELLYARTDKAERMANAALAKARGEIANNYANGCVSLLETLDSITVANRIRIQQESRDPVRRDDGSLHEYTINLPGGPYSCKCGCNVFHHPDCNDLSLYKCNACKAEFHST